MKIEMGESIVYSWLKHCKGCGIVQLNWRPSPIRLEVHENVVAPIMAKAQVAFPHLEALFKKNKPQQFVSQCEIDVLGYNFKEEKVYANEVAFHEGGLLYTDKEETNRRIVAKMIRAAITIHIIFPKVKSSITFITPKISDSYLRPLADNFKKLNDFATTTGLECKFALIAGADFRKEIFEPVCKASLEVADTSELFMRSLKLAKMFEVEGRPSGPEKIGKFVKDTFIKLFEQGGLNEAELTRLQDKDYSRRTFNIGFPMLLRANSAEHLGASERYWKNIFADRFVVCSQWTEKHRPAFERWLATITPNT